MRAVYTGVTDEADEQTLLAAGASCPAELEVMFNEMWTSLRQWTYPDALRIYPQTYESHAEIIAGLCHELRLLHCQLDGAERRMQDITLDELREELLSPFAEATLAEHLEALQTSLIEQRAQCEAQDRQGELRRLETTDQELTAGSPPPRGGSFPPVESTKLGLPDDPTGHASAMEESATRLSESVPSVSAELSSAQHIEDAQLSQIAHDAASEPAPADDSSADPPGPNFALASEFAIAMGNALHALQQTTRPFEGLLKGKQQKAVREAFERVTRVLSEYGVECADLAGHAFDPASPDFEPIATSATTMPEGDIIDHCTEPRISVQGRMVQPARGTVARSDSASE